MNQFFPTSKPTCDIEKSNFKPTLYLNRLMSAQIFTINVIGSSDLDVERPMRNVVVRISIVNGSTGELLPKSNPERQCISSNESTPFISPVCTKPVKIESIINLAPFWDDSFIYNENIDVIMSPDVILFFEIMDLDVPAREHHFAPIAWAFLRLKVNDDSNNIGHPCVLQLHSYPSGFNPSLKGSFVPVFGLLSSRVKVSARLTVEVKSDVPQEPYDVTGRPKHFFQREVGSEDYTKLLHIEEDSDGGEDGENNEEKKKKPRRQVRPSNRDCKIPRKLAAQIPAGERGAHALTFNKNGDLLVAAIQVDNDFTLQFFTTDTFRKIREIRAHVDLIYELSFSDDDRLLLSASADGMVKIWKGDGESKREKSILAHPKYIYSAKFHPQDDRLVVTGGYDGIIRLWDRPKQKVLREYRGNIGTINSLCFSPDGKSLYAGDSNGIITVWRTDLEEDGIDGIQLKIITKEDEIKKVSITSLSMERSNFSLLVHTQDNMIRIFETKVMVPCQRYGGIICQKFQMHSVFSPDGQFILAGSEDGGVMLWTVRKAEPIQVVEWNCRFDQPVTSVAWNRVENMVAFSSFGDAQPIIVFMDPTPPSAPMMDEDPDAI